LNNKNGFAVHTIYRGISKLEDFEEELAEMLSNGYTVVGSGISGEDYVYAIVVKSVSVHKEFTSKTEGQ
jgi:hypothetical protein